MAKPFMNLRVLRQVLRSCSDPNCRETHVDILPEMEPLAFPDPSTDATTPLDTAAGPHAPTDLPASHPARATSGDTATAVLLPRHKITARATAPTPPDTPVHAPSTPHAELHDPTHAAPKPLPPRKRSPYNMRRRNPPQDP